MSENVVFKLAVTEGFGPAGPIVVRTGVDVVDQAFSKELRLIADVLGVIPNLCFVADEGVNNAYAWRAPAEPLGALCIGLGLLTQEIDDNWDFIAFVLAHECGHIMQSLRQTRLSSVEAELHADFIGGYYIGRVSKTGGLMGPESGRRIVQSLSARGDYHTWWHGHHGTPAQRACAFVAGLKSRDLPLDEAYDGAVNVARRNADRWLDPV